VEINRRKEKEKKNRMGLGFDPLTKPNFFWAF
jgi:hypothetical protein